MENHKKQFIYMLKLIHELLDEKNWTSIEEDIVEAHFKSLQYLLSEGKLILAGKTLDIDERTFGIVILEVESEEEAKSLMDNDPAVKGGMMTAELSPFRTALMRSFGE
jgi:uncharacterized protein YciI